MSEQGWRDKQGDVWHLGDDGLMHTSETAAFPPEYVERKWGPLRMTHPTTVPAHAGREGATMSERRTLSGDWAELDREARAAGRELMRTSGITRAATWILDRLTKGPTR